MDDDALDGAKICKLAAKTVLSLLHHINIHYTYILSPAGEENDGDNVYIDLEVSSNDEANDLKEDTVEQDGNEPQFNSILDFFFKIINFLNTLTLTLHSTVNIWS
jgi:hypothetical protein